MATIRPLSTELQEVAACELNENEHRIPEDIKHIREWLKKQPHLYQDWNDQWIITFLRGCKYSLEKTKRKLDLFCSVRTFCPRFFGNRYPFSEAVKYLQTISTIAVLPQTSNPPKPLICLFRFHDTHRYCTFVDVVRYWFMAIDMTIGNNDQLAVCGADAIFDYKEHSLDFAFQTHPVLIKEEIMILEKSYPFRIRGIYAINVPTVVVTLFDIAKQFMSKKMTERMCIYGCNSTNELYKHIPKHVMPIEYGGNNPSISILADEVNKKIEAYGRKFLEDEKYFSNESLRPVNHLSPSDWFNMEGSFRKLEVD